MSRSKSYRFNWQRVAIVLAFVLLISLSFFYNSKGDIQGLNVVIQNPEYKFIDSKGVIDYLQKEGLVKNNSIKKSEVKNIEATLLQNNYIDSAEAYVSKKQDLNIVVRQMEPLARVYLSQNAKSFYLKSNNKLAEISLDYTARVPVVTGFQYVVSDTSFRRDFTELMTYIAQDSFWSVQVQQLDISPDKELSMYPLIGEHQVLIGAPTDYRAKFANLREFYNQVLSRQGFDLYNTVDVRYHQQVVASPSIKAIDTTQKNLES